jgi:alkylation response protein AidB-like acyl-CoA dehydrogenase
MPVALNDEQSALARAVAAFAERHGARESTRKDAVKLKAGERPDHWLELVSLGLHAVHLPEFVGGQGGSIHDVAVVIAEAGRSLLPGPLLPTVFAGAVVSTAPTSTTPPPISSSVSPPELPPRCWGRSRP